MSFAPLADDSSLTDETVLFELDVLNQIKNGKEFFDAKAAKTAPLIIGLDRSTVKHSLNVLATFNTPVLQET